MEINVSNLKNFIKIGDPIGDKNKNVPNTKEEIKNKTLNKSKDEAQVSTAKASNVAHKVSICEESLAVAAAQAKLLVNKYEEYNSFAKNTLSEIDAQAKKNPTPENTKLSNKLKESINELKCKYGDTMDWKEIKLELKKPEYYKNFEKWQKSINPNEFIQFMNELEAGKGVPTEAVAIVLNGISVRGGAA